MNYKPPTGQPKKQSKLLLPGEERKVLFEQMLSDESVNLSQIILKRQFPGFICFMDTCLGKTQPFEVVPRDRPYIQILHAGTLHWVCVSNCEKSKSKNETNYLYDGLSRSHVMDDIVEQIASYANCPEPKMLINTAKNGVECNLFVIAFATTIAFGSVQNKISYDENSL